MKHSGGCHCGKVRYEVEADTSTLLACNCSICFKRGSLLAFTSANKFTLLAGEGETTDYLFNEKTIHHRFCKTCGILSYGDANGPDGKPAVFINARCIDGIDLSKVKIQDYDGRSK